MKKLLWLSLFFIPLMVSAESQIIDHGGLCTQECHEPVCGQVEVQCITTPCTPIKETFCNKCKMYKAHAEFLHFGRCGEEKKSDEKKIPNAYKTPIFGQIDFGAKYDNGKVYMEWSKFVPPSGEEFAWYKIMRSANHNNPVYPDQSAIEYLDNVNSTEYIDKWPHTAYYRVCAITHQKSRSCSKVIRVEVKKEEKHEKYDKKYEQNKVEYYEKKKEYEEKKYEKKKDYHKKVAVSGDLKERLDNWLDKVESRVGKSKMSNENKIEKLYKLKGRLVELGEKRPKLWVAINYLKEGVEAMIETLENNLDDLDSLLDDLF